MGLGKKGEGIKKKNPHSHRQKYGDYPREHGVQGGRRWYSRDKW